MAFYDRVVLADGPAYYLPFDELTGYAGRELVASGSLALNGMSPEARQGRLVLPDGTRAPLFDGTDDQSAGFGETYLPTDLTFEAWGNLMASGTLMMACKDANTGTTDCWQMISLSGTMRWGILNTSGGNLYVSASSAIPLNQWVHLVGTYDNSTTTARLYVNGRLMDSSSSTTGTRANTGTVSITIGARSNSTLRWNGGISRVALYSKVLPAGRIMAHYRAGSARPSRQAFRTRAA